MEQYIPKSALVAEIERLVNNYDKALDYEAALEDVRNFIDSLQEEPVSKDDVNQTVCHQDDVNQTVTEDLEEAAIEICSKILKGETVVIDGYEYVVLSDAEECFKAGAKWQKQQTINRAADWIEKHWPKTSGLAILMYTDSFIKAMED